MSIVQRVSKRRVYRSILWTFLVNGLIPLCLYTWLKHSMTDIAALSIATLAPLFDNVRTLVREKRVDVFAIMMLGSLLVGIGVLFLHGSTRLLLIRESFITGIIGLSFLVSMCFPRPLIYHLALRFATANDSSARSNYARLWEDGRFRRVIYLMTIVWGIALVFEAMIRVILVYMLSTTEFLVLSPFILYGCIGLAALWTMWYRRVAGRQISIRSMLDAD